MGEPGEPQAFFIVLQNNIDVGSLVGMAVAIVLLLAASAVISASESAIFSIGKKDFEALPDDKTKEVLAKVLAMPKRILATILLTNNLVNVAFVLIMAKILRDIIFLEEGVTKKIIEILIETILLLVFGEVIPKIYATMNNIAVGKKVSPLLLGLKYVFSPAINLMVNMSNFFDRKFKKQNAGVSIDELTHAIEITSDEDAPKEEKEILKSIIKFGNRTAKQIMTSRGDMETITIEDDFDAVKDFVINKGFSRVPVVGENFDDIKGILYTKDLLKHTGKGADFNWQRIVRSPLFIPDRKRIDDLLNEFQEKRIHMAIVVDEFGGTEGLVTMEDILEQVFGEILDEFDEDDISYSQLDDNTYLFSAQTLLTDIIAIAKLDEDVFDQYKDESDTLAGLVMELRGGIPHKGEHIVFNQFEFIIESVTSRKINRIKLKINQQDDHTGK